MISDTIEITVHIACLVWQVCLLVITLFLFFGENPQVVAYSAQPSYNIKAKSVRARARVCVCVCVYISLPVKKLILIYLRRTLFRLHLSVLLPCEWWRRRFLNHSNIEAVLIKRQPGDSPRTTKPSLPVKKLILIYLRRTCWHHEFETKATDLLLLVTN